MPYYMRLFSDDDYVLTRRQIESGLSKSCRVEQVSEDETGWRELLIKTDDGREICLLERTPAELAAAEIEEFIEGLKDVQPARASSWVASFLKKCDGVYCCQFLSEGYGDAYGSVPGEVLWNLKQQFGSGLIHAEGEGFSNQDGYHITWEFSDDVTGAWNMAILDHRDEWQTFQMDLANEQHRDAFRRGRVPDKLS